MTTPRSSAAWARSETSAVARPTWRQEGLTAIATSPVSSPAARSGRSPRRARWRGRWRRARNAAGSRGRSSAQTARGDRRRAAEERAPQGIGIGRLDRARQLGRITRQDGPDEYLPAVPQPHAPLVLGRVARRQAATGPRVYAILLLDCGQDYPLPRTLPGGRTLRARTPPGSTKRSTPCWSPTRSCAPPSPTPPAPGPAPTRIGPASPSPGTPLATSSPPS